MGHLHSFELLTFDLLAIAFAQAMLCQGAPEGAGVSSHVKESVPKKLKSYEQLISQMVDHKDLAH